MSDFSHKIERDSTGFKLISWNVNGIRASLKKGFGEFFTSLKKEQSLGSKLPDMIALQEVKAEQQQVDFDFSPYFVIWHSAQKKGYSGTAVLTLQRPLTVQRGFDHGIEDTEGRVLTVEFATFYVVNIYSPNSKRGLLRHDYRVKDWEPALLEHLSTLAKTGKGVIFCGDLNVAHHDIDLANPKTNRNNAGFTIEERQCFSRLLSRGFIDTFRHFYPQVSARYSWWSWRAGVRAKNIGWRIDYCCVSTNFFEHLVAADILDDVVGSDHCPVSVTLNLS